MMFVIDTVIVSFRYDLRGIIGYLSK